MPWSPNSWFSWPVAAPMEYMRPRRVPKMMAGPAPSPPGQYAAPRSGSLIAIRNLKHPLFAAGGRVQRNHPAVGSDHVHGGTNHQGLVLRRVKAGTACPSRLHVVDPRHFQLAHIGWSNLRQSGVARAPRVAAGHGPVPRGCGVGEGEGKKRQQQKKTKEAKCDSRVEFLVQSDAPSVLSWAFSLSIPRSCSRWRPARSGLR